MKAERIRLLTLFLLAVSIRLLYVCSTSPQSAIGSTDAWGYHQLALNLERGNGFSLRRQAPFVLDSLRTPLYPAFLWLIRRSLGPTLRTATIVQALLDGLTTLLTWWLAAQLGGRRAARIAALLYALNPTQVRYVNELLTETLLSWLLTLCACTVTRYVHSKAADATKTASVTETAIPATVGPYGTSGAPRLRLSTAGWMLIVGTLSGLAALCKPNVQFLPLVWLLAIALVHRRSQWHGWTDASLMMASVLLVLAPWATRNYLVFGRWFLSTAFEGNISRVSVPATLITERGEYPIPWSAEWEAAFGEIVSQAAARYHWHVSWDALTTGELDTANRQIYLVAREVLFKYPLAWFSSHMRGIGRYLEPQTYRVCYTRFSGKEWPPDILDDAVIHLFRAIGRGDWGEAGQIVAQERWSKFNVLQGVVWWGTFVGQIVGLVLMLRGAWQLRHQPSLVIPLLLTIGYVLWIPGPIAYERFRVPVMSLIVTLIGVSGSVDLALPKGPCYNRKLPAISQLPSAGQQILDPCATVQPPVAQE